MLRRFVGLGLIALLTACAAVPAVPRTSSTAVAATPSQAPALAVVTIGDSIPFGQGDCGGCTDFTTLLAEALQQSSAKTVVPYNLSTRDNLTGARLLDRIRTVQDFRQTVSQGVVIVVTIGHNDTPWNSTNDPCDGNNPDGLFNWPKYTGACVTQQAKRHGTELDGILTEIAKLRSGKPTAIRVTTDYNDVVGWSGAPREANAPSIEVLNAFYVETCRVAAQHNAACVDVYHAFNGAQGKTQPVGLLADDHTHPNAKGQQKIADLLIAAGFAPILP